MSPIAASAPFISFQFTLVALGVFLIAVGVISIIGVLISLGVFD